jgi:hypothetical protein
MASLIIALVAVFSALSPVPYVTSYGIWVAILAYVVLAVGNLALGHAALPLCCTTQPVDDAAELYQQPITSSFDDPAMMLGDLRID